MLDAERRTANASSRLIAAKPKTDISRRGDKQHSAPLLSEPGIPNSERRTVNGER
jgi:hypothetical protein